MMSPLTDEQAEEVEAMAAIYPTEWTTISDAKFRLEFELKYLRNGDYPDPPKITFTVELPRGYPAESPPVVDLQSPWIGKPAMNSLLSELQGIYLDNLGSTVLFPWAQKIEEFVTERAKLHELSHQENPPLPYEPSIRDYDLTEVETHEVSSVNVGPRMEIVHGDIISDRKSTFQGHAARVTSVSEVEAVVGQLMENRKIATATHNIRAFRLFCTEKQAVIQDCDDDGETHAGGRLLHLLQMTKCMNVVVVVTRWYGGSLLGPDRFKHINNAARQVLTSGAFLASEVSDGSCSDNRKKRH